MRLKRNQRPENLATRNDHLTAHAKERMSERRIESNEVDSAIEFGRRHHVRGAVVYVIGRREIRRNADKLKSTDRLEGLHVICKHNGVVITTYRNRSFCRHDFVDRKPRRRVSRFDNRKRL